MAKKLKYLVWHCTATPEGRWVSPENIIEWHTSKPPKGRGWKQVGYSKLVLLDGTIHSFVDENDDDYVDDWEVTNGAVGINSVSRHYCYVGGLDKDTFQPKDTRTDAQKKVMKELTRIFLKKYEHLVIEVRGHYHFAKKACPCFDVEEWMINEILKEDPIPAKEVDLRKNPIYSFFDWLKRINNGA